MTTTDTDTARDALIEALRLDPANQEARAVLADLLEDIGEDDLANVQRELVGLEPYELCADEARAVLEGAPSSGWFSSIGDGSDEWVERIPTLELWQGWDAELGVYVFQIRWEADSDETYVVCQGDGALLWASLRRKAGLPIESDFEDFGPIAHREGSEE